MANKENKKQKLPREVLNAKNGTVAEAFSQKVGITISANPLRGCGRVSFKLFEKNTGGSKNIMYYMETDDMRSLCEDIRSGVFFKKLAEPIKKDKNGNPIAPYHYIGGVNGSIFFNISAGDTGILLNAFDRNTKYKYTISVTPAFIKDMAFYFMLYTGLIYVRPGSYYEELLNDFNEGCKEREVKYGKVVIEDDDSGNKVSAQDEDDADANDVSNVVTEKKDPVKNEKPANNASVDKAFKVKVSGTYRKEKGFYVFDGVDNESNEKVSLMFRIQALPQWFDQFVDSINKKGSAELKFVGEKRDNYILYKKGNA